MSEVNWRFVPFAHLSAAEVYEALALRQRVFMLEQGIAVQDADGLDAGAWHLIGRGTDGVVAYARLFAPEDAAGVVKIGRVVVAEEARGQGLGRDLMDHALACAADLAPGFPVKISAQHHLVRFYETLGFRIAGDVYDDHGVPHVDMVREPEAISPA